MTPKEERIQLWMKIMKRRQGEWVLLCVIRVICCREFTRRESNITVGFQIIINTIVGRTNGDIQ